MDSFECTLKKAVEDRVAQIINEEARRAAGVVESRVREMVGEIATTVASQMTFERIGTQLVIRVELPNKSV